MKKILGALVLVVILFLTPSAQAQTLFATDRQTLIAQLLAQVAILQQRIAELGLPAQPGGTSASSPSCVITRTLAFGTRGANVTCLQQFLIAQEFLAPDSATGYFGRLTETALKQFQQTRGLEPVGIVGPRTRAIINAGNVSVAGGDIISESTNGGSPGGSSFGGVGAPPPAASCTLDSVTLAHGTSQIFYSASTALYPATCTAISQSRTCRNGTLSGDASFNKASCSVATTSDDCAIWPSPVNNTLSLQDAVNANACVNIAAGTYILEGEIFIPSKHTLKGASATSTTLKANPQTWKPTFADALLGRSVFGSDGKPDPGLAKDINISGLTLDASGIATYAIVAGGMTIDSVVMTRGRCSAIAINGPRIILRNSTLDRSAQTTVIPNRGSFNCATIPPGLPLGGAIYGKGFVGNRNFAPIIENNIIKNSIGPGVDISNVDGGILANNIIFGNSGYAAVNLYETTGWQVLNNHISHSPTEPPQPYHLDCARGPSGGHSAGILLCSDTYHLTNGPTSSSTNNRIIGNQSSSFYGILLVGAGTASNPALSPYGNVIENNDTRGSNGPCGDSFNPAWATATIPANAWSGNYCSAGAANSPPYYF